jgi:hypothetical protein
MHRKTHLFIAALVVIVMLVSTSPTANTGS